MSGVGELARPGTGVGTGTGTGTGQRCNQHSSMDGSYGEFHKITAVTNIINNLLFMEFPDKLLLLSEGSVGPAQWQYLTELLQNRNQLFKMCD